MKRLNRTVLVGGLVAALAVGQTLGLPDAARAATLETREVRDWTMSAYTNDETGDFSHCAIYARYRNGLLLLISVDRDDDYTLGFSGEALSFEAGSEVPVDVSVDGRVVGRTAFAIDTDHISLFIAKGAPIIRRLKRGRRITARISGETYLFDLENSAYALEQAEDCVADHLRRGSRSEPARTARADPEATTGPATDIATDSATDTAPTGTAGDRLATHLEAAILSANLLARLPLDDWRLLAPDAIPQFAERYDAFWRSEAVIGGVMLFPPEGEEVTATSLRRDIVSDDAASCAGNFTSAQAATSAPGTHFVVSCSAIDPPWSSFYSIVERPGGGYVVFATASVSADLSVAARVGLETATRAQETVTSVASASGE